MDGKYTNAARDLTNCYLGIQKYGLGKKRKRKEELAPKISPVHSVQNVDLL